MRPCNKNQFQSIRIQKKYTTKRQEEEDDEDRKPKKTQIETFFHYFSTEGSVGRVVIGRINPISSSVRRGRRKSFKLKIINENNNMSPFRYREESTHIHTYI